LQPSQQGPEVHWQQEPFWQVPPLQAVPLVLLEWPQVPLALQ